MKLSVRQILGNLLIAIALIVVPFSMSHASKTDVANQNVHNIFVDENAGLHHNVDQQRTNNSSEHFGHDEHDAADCCSSICGGALAADFTNSPLKPRADVKVAFGVSSLKPGELALPFRPPSI